MNKHTRSVSLIDGHTEEMTDAEIMKALKCCKVEFENCEKCPYGGIDCLTEKGESLIMRDALDLINRQQAEIEKLNVELVGMRGACESYKIHYDNAQAEIERLQKIIVGFMDEVGTWSNKYDVDISNIHKLPILAKEDYNIKNKIKSEAIKKFAERLKKKASSIVTSCQGYEIYETKQYQISAINFDNLVKEMTEVSE